MRNPILLCGAVLLAALLISLGAMAQGTQQRQIVQTSFFWRTILTNETGQASLIALGASGSNNTATVLVLNVTSNAFITMLNSVSNFFDSTITSNLFVTSNAYFTTTVTTNAFFENANAITNFFQQAFGVNLYVSNGFFGTLTVDNLTVRSNSNLHYMADQSGFATNATIYDLEVHDDFIFISDTNPIFDLSDTNGNHFGGFDIALGGWNGPAAGITNLPFGFISVTNDPYNPNVRRLAAGANITLTDGGPGSTLTVASSGTVSSSYFASNALSGGQFPAATMPAFTGDITTVAGAVATTLATVNGNTGSFGDATHVPQVTLSAKGLTTAAASVLITPSYTNVTDRTATITNMCDGLHPDASVPMQRFTTNASFNIAGFANLKSSFDNMFSMCISNSAAGNITVGGPPNSGYIGSASTNSLVIPGGKEAYYSFDIYAMTDTNTVNALKQ